MKPFNIELKNRVIFKCDNNTSILNGSIESGKTLDHSCKIGKCRSCIVKVLEGKAIETQENIILSKEEIEQGYILSCINKPLSDLKLDIEDLGDIKLSKARTVPCKIDSLTKMSNDVLKVVLRLPSSIDFTFISGQYVNIIKGSIKRSYSIANNQRVDGKLEFFIKKYQNGQMSQYLFEEAKINDLLRIEGPLGTFFLRESKFKNIVFLATGTGIAPVKSILEQLNENDQFFKNKKVWIFWGGRHQKDIFWKPNINDSNFNFTPVLSREDVTWEGEKGYVQDALLKQKLNLNDAQVYACGSLDMIKCSQQVLTDNGLHKDRFYSDAFVNSN